MIDTRDSDEPRGDLSGVSSETLKSWLGECSGSLTETDLAVLRELQRRAERRAGASRPASLTGPSDRRAADALERIAAAVEGMCVSRLARAERRIAALEAWREEAGLPPVRVCGCGEDAR